MTQIQKGTYLLRLGMAGVYLWFGFSQLFDSLNWVSFVPEWASSLLHLSPSMIVLGNGLFEVTAATLLAMNFFVRPVAILLSLHLLVIAFGLRTSPTGIRDFGLTIATFSLFFLSPAQQIKSKLKEA